ncbi:histidine N-alpha-methyltransferase-like [Mya arenaria]|uniref:histidine N-alpha-methyltransferase-like n=1 Tax=Mya arenaria TaxID=6604 RepID=UPI0022E2755B|nr:histidine N-alpha-methyltransferase-like [Mya arenaria]
MDVKAALVSGLTSDPRRLPVWYRYDNQGSIFDDLYSSENKDYYFYSLETEVLSNNVQEIVSEIVSPCFFVDLGSGNSEKSRMIIDAILREQTVLNYIPVDISSEFLKDVSNSLSRDYGDCLQVTPVPRDYSEGISYLRSISDAKLILWLGGLHSLPYDKQLDTLSQLAKSMSGQDRLVVSLDMTQDAEIVIKAYLPPTGSGQNLYSNALWRLNREYGSDVKTDNFRLEGRFKRSEEGCSGIIVKAVSNTNQHIHIPGLHLSFDLLEGEGIYLHEGEYLSCKYTETQVRALTEKAGLTLNRMWTDAGRRVGIFCFTSKLSNISS